MSEIYAIGTEFLYFRCLVTTDMFLFSISIIPEDLESSRRDLVFDSVKTRFKAILKNVDFGAWIRRKLMKQSEKWQRGDAKEQG